MKQIIKTPPLVETHPHFVKEWHPTKNQPLTPLTATFGMNRKVWWQCQEGHEWQATINQRSSKGSQCPFCSGRRLQRGVNDLATTHPHLVKEWHPTKNHPLTPQDVRKGSNRIVWWLCEQGHEWEASLMNRSHGTKCPYCTNKRIAIGFNDLATTHPNLAKEWHPTKNEGLTPQQISRGMKDHFWWQCEHGHEWRATPIQRTYRGSRCPQCHPKGIKIGVNDLATRNPKLAHEWHPTKNGTLTPKQVGIYSLRLVWWQCQEGHEWLETVMYRYRGNGCPTCLAKK